MEIRQFQTFLAIVEFGSFSQAADKLGYAQSTITAHIQQLESELGPLFERLGKTISLTNRGRQLVPRARQLLTVYREIEQLATDEEMSGQLRIGAAESLAVYRLAPLLKQFKTLYPRVELILRHSLCRDLRRQLATGELDIAFTIEERIQAPELVVTALKEEPLLLVHLGDGQRNVILSEPNCSFRLCFEAYLQRVGWSYETPLEMVSIEGIKQCVRNGLGVAMLPSYTLTAHDSFITEPIGTMWSQMSYHRDKRLTLPLQRFIELAQQILEES